MAEHGMTRRMGRLTALVVLALAGTAVTAAGQGGLALKGGITFAGGVDGPDWSARAGWMAGGDYEFLLGGKVLGIAPGVFYQVRLGESQIGGSATEVTLKDIHVPLVLKVNIPLVLVTPYAVGGGYYNFNLTCQTGDTDCDQKPNDYGGVLGAGIAIGGGFLVEFRYLWGAATLEDAIPDLTDLRLGTFTAVLGLRF